MIKFIGILIYIVALAQVAYAHPPSFIKTHYDPSGRKLSVEVRHMVGRSWDHYISKIELLRNGNELASTEFGEQKTDYTQTARFTLPELDPTDIITVTAYCNISGELTETVDIAEGPDASDEQSLKDGRFLAKNAMMHVAVTVRGGRITDIEILQHGSAEEYTNKMMPLIDKIIKQQSADVDAVTGATLSSNALKALVENALKQAGQ